MKTQPSALPADRLRHAAAADAARELDHDLLRLTYDYLPVSQLVSVINAIVLVGVQSLVIKTGVLVLWLFAVCIVALIRILGGLAFRRHVLQPGEIARWRAYAIAGAAANGMVWGSAAFFLFPEGHVGHQVFLAFVPGGMVAGSASTLTPVLPAFLVFATLVLVPTMVRFVLEHQLIH